MNESYVFKLISLFQKRKTSSSNEHQTKRQIQNYRNNDNGTSMLLYKKTVSLKLEYLSDGNRLKTVIIHCKKNIVGLT